MPKRRGIWKSVDGRAWRFELNRKRGLLVQQRRRKARIVSWQELVDVAEGQLKMNLI